MMRNSSAPWLLATFVLLCASVALSQNVTRTLRSQFLYSGQGGYSGTTAREKASFVFFYTPNFESQTISLAVAAKVPAGWVAIGISADPFGNMINPGGNTAVQGFASGTIQKRSLMGRTTSETPITNSFNIDNSSVVVDGDYLVLRFTWPFSFTQTSRFTFLLAAKSDEIHDFHDFGYYRVSNVQLVSGVGLSSVVVCNDSNCAGSCLEPYYCDKPISSPVSAPSSSPPEGCREMQGCAPGKCGSIEGNCGGLIKCPPCDDGIPLEPQQPPVSGPEPENPPLRRDSGIPSSSQASKFKIPFILWYSWSIWILQFLERAIGP